MHATPQTATPSAPSMVALCWVCCCWRCAGPNAVTSQVSSYGSWPEGRKPGRYVLNGCLPSRPVPSSKTDWRLRPNLSWLQPV